MHKNTSLKIIFKFAKLMEGKDVIDIGKELSELNVDDLIGPGGFWIRDLESDIQYYSDNLIESLGFDSVEYTADFWHELITEDGFKSAIRAYEEVIEGGKYYYETEYNTSSDEILKVVCSGELVNFKGKPKYLVGTHKIVKSNGESD